MEPSLRENILKTPEEEENREGVLATNNLGKEMRIEIEEDNSREEVSILNRCEIYGMGSNDNTRDAFVSENVVNLSKRVLTNSEIKVLSRGRNLCPTPKEIDKAAVIKDLSELSRRMKCKADFAQNGEARNLSDELIRFKVKSTWKPTRVDPVLDLILKNLEERISFIEERGYNFRNLSKEKRKALKDLKGYTDIVIKEADKGSAVVVWAMDDYCKEAYRNLGDG